MEEILSINFAESFGTFSGLAALNVVIVNLITTYCKIKTSWIKQVISWIIPIIISIIGFVFNLGLFENYTVLVEWQGWIYTILTGLGIGLTSNGIFDISFVRNLLNNLNNLINKFKLFNKNNIISDNSSPYEIEIHNDELTGEITIKGKPIETYPVEYLFPKDLNENENKSK
jgi:hypothetical protein